MLSPIDAKFEIKLAGVVVVTAILGFKVTVGASLVFSAVALMTLTINTTKIGFSFIAVKLLARKFLLNFFHCFLIPLKLNT